MRYRRIGTIAMVCMLGLALAVTGISSVPARTRGNPVKTYPGISSPGEGTGEQEPPALIKHVLSSELYDTSNGASASCNSIRCTATTNLWTESIACPGPVGTKCTYEIDVAGQLVVSPAGEGGFYQFLIDGATPTGGGTDGGNYNWQESGASGQYSADYSVTSQVQNAVANQSHVVVVNLGCFDFGYGGCTVTAGFSDLTVGVLKP